MLSNIASKCPTTQFVFWRIRGVATRPDTQGSSALAIRGRRLVLIVVILGLRAVESTGFSGQEVTEGHHFETG